METVVDNLGKADPDWQAHFRSREVWTAAKWHARFLNQQKCYIIDSLLTASLNI